MRKICDKSSEMPSCTKIVWEVLYIAFLYIGKHACKVFISYIKLQVTASLFFSQPLRQEAQAALPGVRPAWRECSRGGYAEYFFRKGGHRIMTVTAWIMLAFYVVVLGGGSVALVTYSLKKNDI